MLLLIHESTYAITYTFIHAHPSIHLPILIKVVGTHILGILHSRGSPILDTHILILGSYILIQVDKWLDWVLDCCRKVISFLDHQVEVQAYLEHQ